MRAATAGGGRLWNTADVAGRRHPPGPAGGRVIVGALREATTDQVSLAAAGCAFYATLALFPAISVLISVYGLAFNVRAVEQQLEVLRELLPPPAFALIDERVHELVSQPNDTLSIGLIISLIVAFWSAAAGTKSVLSALNVAYDTDGAARHRGLPARRSGHDAVRRGGGRAGDRGAGVPAGGDLVRRPVRLQRRADQCDQHGLLLVLVGGTIALLYRYRARHATEPPDRRIFPGAIAGHACCG